MAVHGETFFRQIGFAGLRPGNAEWVGGPEADGRDGDEHVLPGFEGPGTSHVDSDADGITWQSFDHGFGACFGKVAVCQNEEADDAFSTPKTEDDLEIHSLRILVQVYPNSS